jgi:sugar (glycoside-pentoside-hexuronide) transporter
VIGYPLLMTVITTGRVMTTTNQYQTTYLERVSYGSYAFGQNIVFMVVLQFLMLYYTDELGIGAGAVGLLFFVARAWDAINDPLFGIIVDKLNLEGGKFKPWINAAVFLIPLATLCLFVSPVTGETSTLIYAYASYIIWGMFYTLSDVPYFALSTVMTTRVRERVALITISRMFAMVAAMLSLSLFMPLVRAIGWTPSAAIMAGAALLAMLPMRFAARERVRIDRQQGISLSQIYHFVRNNRPMLVFYSAFLAFAVLNTTLIVGNYFAIYALGDTDGSLVSILAATAALPVILVVPFLPVLISRYGKKRLFIGFTALGIAGNLLFYIVGYANLGLVIGLNVLRGIGMGMPMIMLGLFSQDFVEYGNHRTGSRAEGITFSIQTFATKMSQALGAVVGGVLLGTVYGYAPNREQSAETINGIFFMYTLLPGIGMLIALLIMWIFYDLEEKRVQEMIDEVVLLKGGVVQD